MIIGTIRLSARQRASFSPSSSGPKSSRIRLHVLARRAPELSRVCHERSEIIRRIVVPSTSFRIRHPISDSINTGNVFVFETVFFFFIFFNLNAKLV